MKMWHFPKHKRNVSFATIFFISILVSATVFWLLLAAAGTGLFGLGISTSPRPSAH